MSAVPMPQRLAAALVAGSATAMYYATPDVITSRTARGWAKAALVAVASAASVPDLRAMGAVTRAEEAEHGQAVSLADLRALPTRSRIAVGGSVVLVLGGSVGSVVAIERWIFRRGQARAAAGRRLPHTRAALVYGAIAAGLTLVPTPSATGPRPRQSDVAGDVGSS